MASIPNLQDVMFMDSGGSSCLQNGYDVYYATSERRRIADALVFYCDKDDDIPEQELDPEDQMVLALRAKIRELEEKIQKAKEALL